MQEQMQTIIDEISRCQKCGLCRARQKTVPGEGSLTARLMIVGEGPGAEEDRQGHPFVGPAGHLLDMMLESISLKREEVYIANVVKCRPPGNRTPADDESLACFDYLCRQIAVVDPELILCMGTPASRRLIDPAMRVSRDRGIFHEIDGRVYLATYHPAALLRDNRLMIDAWRDMQMVKERLANGE